MRHSASPVPIRCFELHRHRARLISCSKKLKAISQTKLKNIHAVRAKTSVNGVGNNGMISGVANLASASIAAISKAV